jgi:hypothetical protein
LSNTHRSKIANNTIEALKEDTVVYAGSGGNNDFENNIIAGDNNPVSSVGIYLKNETGYTVKCNTITHVLDNIKIEPMPSNYQDILNANAVCDPSSTGS